VGVDASSVRALLSEAKAALLRLVEVASVAADLTRALAQHDEWLVRAERLFLKPGSVRSLLEVLRADEAAPNAWPPCDDENLLCCPCCTPEHTGIPDAVTWLGCDGCDAWFHSVCVRVPDELAETLESFTCPRCAVSSGAPYAFAPLGGLVPPILRTMRPRCEAVAALLADAQTLRLGAPVEALAMRESLHATMRWRDALRDETADGAALDGRVTPPTNERLIELLRQATALEVEPLAEVSRLRALALQRGAAL
jgi:hypothetical protein